MKVALIKKAKDGYYSLIHSLTFVPFIMLISFAAFAILMIALHDTKVGIKLLNLFPWIKIENASHAANIITALLTGVISLTVFSFSVVMIILSQAAQNLIPKVLYKLKEDKFMQVVLGCYIGTITYYIILLINFGKTGDDFFVPQLAFFCGIIFALVDIFLFVYFMHRTSLSIHAKIITERIYNDTKEKLEQEVKKYQEDPETKHIEDQTNWVIYHSNSSGYLQSVDDETVNFLKKKDIIMKVYPVFGDFVIEKMPLFSLNREVKTEEAKEVESGFSFYSEERVTENSKYGFRQITEIALKALSPGINDPGTAIFCIEYLTHLFSILIEQKKNVYKRDKEGNLRMVGKDEAFKDIMFFSFTPIRNYGKKDVQVLEALVKSLAKIALHDEEQKYKKNLNDHLVAIIATAEENLSINFDLNHLKEIITHTSKDNGYFEPGKFKV